MKRNRIGGFIAESRPHPDYLGSGWWEDMELLVQEAKRLGLKMWIIDDGSYPSGTANGLIGERYPNIRKDIWRCSMWMRTRPVNGESSLISGWRTGTQFPVRYVGRQLNYDTQVLGGFLDRCERFCRTRFWYRLFPEGNGGFLYAR